MEIKVGDYKVRTDSLQFIVEGRTIIQEGRLTKAENVGKERWQPVAYCTKLEDALKFIPQKVFRDNEDINIIKGKLEQIQADIKAIKEIPQIENKDTVTITKEEYNSLLESDNKLTALEGAGVDNWEGYDYAMEMLREDEEDESTGTNE
jgi:hypothetical protein